MCKWYNTMIKMKEKQGYKVDMSYIDKNKDIFNNTIIY